MTEKFKNKYRIPPARLQTWDYGNNGAYFITICTKNRLHYFGEIITELQESEMQLSDIGRLAERFWTEIPIHFPFVKLGKFIVMPNHIHGILIISKKAQEIAIQQEPKINKNKTIGQNRFQNQGKNTISSIVGSFKSVVTKNAHLINPDFEWQSRFHDHIISDSITFNKIQNYIAHNIKNWKLDKFYP